MNQTVTDLARQDQRGQTVTSTGLATTTEESRELVKGAAGQAARAEVESAIIIARRFPRNEDQAFGALMRSCGRITFAADVCYKYPRGGSEVKGPSVKLAREAARVWGNVRYGFYIVSDDDNERHIRGWAWDLETNTKTELDDTFKKLVYRKKGGWVKPDERDLRELTNKRGAILERNCVLKIVPPDLIDDAIVKSDRTLRDGVADDLEGHRKRVIQGFAAFGVEPVDLEKYLGHPLRTSTPDEIADLRSVWKSINDGQSTWSDYLESDAAAGATGTTGAVTGDALSNPKAASKGKPKAPERSEAFASFEAELQSADDEMGIRYLTSSAIPDAVEDGKLTEAERDELIAIGDVKIASALQAAGTASSSGSDQG